MILGKREHSLDGDEDDREKDHVSYYPCKDMCADITLRWVRKMQMLSVRATELPSVIIVSQLRHKNRIWIRGLVDRNIRGDISLLLKGVRRYAGANMAEVRSTFA